MAAWRGLDEAGRKEFDDEAERLKGAYDAEVSPPPSVHTHSQGGQHLHRHGAGEFHVCACTARPRG